MLCVAWAFMSAPARADDNAYFEDSNVNGNANGNAVDPQEDSSVTQDSKPRARKDRVAQNGPEPLPLASSPHIRRFHAVLDELLAEFGYDVKMGQIKGLSNVAIRKVKVSQAIPHTYEDYVEMLLIERMRENSQVRIIDCIPCKTRTSTLIDGKLMITSPATNMAKLEAAASTLGIENFMDVVLVYHTTHMVLAVDVFNSQSKEIVWARTYNSETIKSRYQKLAVDYHQVEAAKPGEDYSPEYRLMLGVGGASIPNISGKAADAAMLNVQMRSTEKFDNRHSEVGLLLSVLESSSGLVGKGKTMDTSTSTTPTPKPFSTAVGIYAYFSHLFVGQVESYNDIRTGAGLGLGTLLASGYLAPALRAGVDIFMGRRFSFTIGGDYVAPATVVVSGVSVKAKGGPGGDAIFSVNF